MAANTGQNSNGNSAGQGCGCWPILVIIGLAAVAIYFAEYRAADFPGADQIRIVVSAGQNIYSQLQETDNASSPAPVRIPSPVPTVEAITPSSPNTKRIRSAPAATIKPIITSFHDTEDERQAFADPSERHLELKQLMLELTNQRRAAAGAPPVILGANTAAQLHAEASLAGCYSGHWDQWGLKPNHRYTLTGGSGADGENGSGSNYCIKPSENYRAITSMDDKVAETVDGWMESPGHRRNLLDPAHTVLNVGIAHDRFNHVMVQQFASDYVNYTVRPNIDSDGILRLKGTVSGATLNIGQTANIQIYYDPPPKPLTRGQLSYTYSLCSPIQVAYIVKPLSGGSFYASPAVKQEKVERRCIDPYQTNPHEPAANSNEEANLIWARAKQDSSTATFVRTAFVRLIAERMDLFDDNMSIRADLTPILREHGPGIYTVTLWGRPLHIAELAIISKQSIFWLTDTPDDSPYVGR